MTNHRDEETKAAPPGQRQTGLQGAEGAPCPQRRASRPGTKTQERPGRAQDLHGWFSDPNAPFQGVPAAVLPWPLLDRAPQMSGFCREGPPSNLNRGITRGGAEKGFLTSCSQRVGGHMESLWPTAQRLWLGWGRGGAGPEVGAHRAPGRRRVRLPQALPTPADEPSWATHAR